VTPAAETLRRQALRQARTRALAGRVRAARHETPTSSFLICTCGGDRYGLHLPQVAQVLSGRAITPVPGAPAAILGAIALSGRVLSVLALARALGRHGAAVAETGHLVILRAAAIALAVDRVEGVLAVADADPDGRAPREGLVDPVAAGLSGGMVSGYAPARAGAARESEQESSRESGRESNPESGFVVVDLPRLLRRYLS
jgi:purine-binding chemotaxis protein CheW